MIKLLLIFILPLALNASRILNYNVYDRTDRADIMLTFDTPYSGVIKQSTSKSKIIIKLYDAKIESSKLKQLASKFLYSISITPMAGYTQIIASVPESIKLRASKTSDAYGLRLRFSDKGPSKTTNSSQKNDTLLSTLPTKKETEITSNYYIVIGLLIVGILILFIVKKRITPKKEKQDAWLFKENGSEQAIKNSHQEDTQQAVNLDKNVSIRFQKNIDTHNSVVMLDFAEKSYLVLMGSSNILLDKFIENRPATEEDFETILKERHQELDDFLRIESEAKSNNIPEEKTIDALQSYKDRAAYISYES